MALELLQLASRFADMELLQAMQHQLYNSLSPDTVVTIGRVAKIIPLAQPLLHAALVFICRHSTDCADSRDVLEWLGESDAGMLQRVVCSLLGVPLGGESAPHDHSGGSPQSAAASCA